VRRRRVEIWVEISTSYDVTSVGMSQLDCIKVLLCKRRGRREGGKIPE
jgi:hypothetical protein